MNILVGTYQLEHVGGTENYTYAIIVELLRRGHHVEYFTFKRGNVSLRIEELGVSFKRRNRYNLVIANHNAVVDSIRQCGFIIQTCHGVFPELEQPSPNADAFVSITQEVQEHLQEKGYESVIVWNGIDCDRFHPTSELNPQLHTVLSLCQSEEANRFIEECCSQLGIELLKANKYSDNVWNVEDMINKADLVVGIGRSIYDAMACGRCVVSFDHRSYSGPCGDGYITSDNIRNYLRNNCSGRYSKTLFTRQSFIAELNRYNPSDGKALREFVLKEMNISNVVSKYISIKKPLSLPELLKKEPAYIRARKVLKKILCLYSFLTIEKQKERKILKYIQEPQEDISLKISVKLLPETWTNSLFIEEGITIVAIKDKIIEVSDSSKELLYIPGASDWRLLYKDSNGNIYTSPHASVCGSINPAQRGLYRKSSLSDRFEKVISLYSVESPVITERILNDDTIWTMCEDKDGYLYAGVYAHTMRNNPVVYKSTDGGMTWHIIINFLEFNKYAKHIHCISYDKYHDALYCLVGEVNTLYKSIDGGANWIDTQLHTGGLFCQKCTVVMPTEHFRILGSDGPYNFELFITEDDKHYKTVFQGWGGVVFGIRKSDLSGNIYAFTKLDISVEDENYMPPIQCKNPYVWLRQNFFERKDWLAYNYSCKKRFPKDAIRPQHAAILVSSDEGQSWSILHKEYVGSESNYGFWIAGTFVDGKCTFSLMSKDHNGQKSFTKTYLVDEKELLAK